MLSHLTKKVFSEALLPEVNDFECGTNNWSRDVSDWIKNDAIRLMERRKTAVWLYENEEHHQVGYGSLGVTIWPLVFPEDPKKRLQILPSLGVRSAFQNRGYAKEICADLIKEAQEFFDKERQGGRELYPFLGLFVHPENHIAKAVYQSLGFRRYHFKSHDRILNIDYESMIIFLNWS